MNFDHPFLFVLEILGDHRMARKQLVKPAGNGLVGRPEAALALGVEAQVLTAFDAPGVK